MKFLKIVFAIPFLFYLHIGVCADVPAVIGQPLPPWKAGYLDIHHIHEGRGNATFMIFPDGTTLLFDMGDISKTNKVAIQLEKYSETLPNNSKEPYEWVADYINRFSPEPGELDYVVLSHYHFDHIGEWDLSRKYQAQGHYRLFGITGLAEKIHIHTLIDRSFPDYEHHGDIPGMLSQYLDSSNEYAQKTAHTLQDYKTFIQYQIKQGMHVEKFQVGSAAQIHLLKHPYADFQVRNIIGNGYVWTGKNNDAYHFITAAQNDLGQQKIENDLSLGIRIDYGSFRYFTGGDITGLTLTGQAVSSSAEAVAAPVIGKVDVATMDHHGFADAQSEAFVRDLRPSVWIQQNWAASQTSLGMLMRTLDTQAYPYRRDLFALHHFPLNDLSLPFFGDPNKNNSAVDHYYTASMGHIVVRVAPGGKRFWIIMLTSDTDKPVVQAIYGPYLSMEK